LVVALVLWTLLLPSMQALDAAVLSATYNKNYAVPREIEVSATFNKAMNPAYIKNIFLYSSTDPGKTFAIGAANNSSKIRLDSADGSNRTVIFRIVIWDPEELYYANNKLQDGSYFLNLGDWNLKGADGTWVPEGTTAQFTIADNAPAAKAPVLQKIVLTDDSCVDLYFDKPMTSSIWPNADLSVAKRNGFKKIFNIAEAHISIKGDNPNVIRFSNTEYIDYWTWRDVWDDFSGYTEIVLKEENDRIITFKAVDGGIYTAPDIYGGARIYAYVQREGLTPDKEEIVSALSIFQCAMETSADIQLISNLVSSDATDKMRLTHATDAAKGAYSLQVQVKNIGTRLTLDSGKSVRTADNRYVKIWIKPAMGAKSATFYVNNTKIRSDKDGDGTFVVGQDFVTGNWSEITLDLLKADTPVHIAESLEVYLNTDSIWFFDEITTWKNNEKIVDFTQYLALNRPNVTVTDGKMTGNGHTVERADGGYDVVTDGQKIEKIEIFDPATQTVKNTYNAALLDIGGGSGFAEYFLTANNATYQVLNGTSAQNAIVAILDQTVKTALDLDQVTVVWKPTYLGKSANDRYYLAQEYSFSSPSGYPYYDYRSQAYVRIYDAVSGNSINTVNSVVSYSGLRSSTSSPPPIYSYATYLVLNNQSIVELFDSDALSGSTIQHVIGNIAPVAGKICVNGNQILKAAGDPKPGVLLGESNNKFYALDTTRQNMIAVSIDSYTATQYLLTTTSGYTYVHSAAIDAKNNKIYYALSASAASKPKVLFIFDPVTGKSEHLYTIGNNISIEHLTVFNTGLLALGNNIYFDPAEKKEVAFPLANNKYFSTLAYKEIYDISEKGNAVAYTDMSNNKKIAHAVDPTLQGSSKYLLSIDGRQNWMTYKNGEWKIVSNSPSVHGMTAGEINELTAADFAKLYEDGRTIYSVNFSISLAPDSSAIHVFLEEKRATISGGSESYAVKSAAVNGKSYRKIYKIVPVETSDDGTDIRYFIKAGGNYYTVENGMLSSESTAGVSDMLENPRGSFNDLYTLGMPAETVKTLSEAALTETLAFKDFTIVYVIRSSKEDVNTLAVKFIVDYSKKLFSDGTLKLIISMGNGNADAFPGITSEQVEDFMEWLFRRQSGYGNVFYTLKIGSATHFINYYKIDSVKVDEVTDDADDDFEVADNSNTDIVDETPPDNPSVPMVLGTPEIHTDNSITIAFTEPVLEDMAAAAFTLFDTVTGEEIANSAVSVTYTGETKTGVTLAFAELSAVPTGYFTLKIEGISMYNPFGTLISPYEFRFIANNTMNAEDTDSPAVISAELDGNNNIVLTCDKPVQLTRKVTGEIEYSFYKLYDNSGNLLVGAASDVTVNGATITISFTEGDGNAVEFDGLDSVTEGVFRIELSACAVFDENGNYSETYAGTDLQIGTPATEE